MVRATLVFSVGSAFLLKSRQTGHGSQSTSFSWATEPIEHQEDTALIRLRFKPKRTIFFLCKTLAYKFVN